MQKGDEFLNKEKILKKVQLYAIADPSLCLRKDLFKLINLAIEGGAQMIQFRDKESSDKEFLEKAREIHKITLRKKIPLIINDRVDIAKLINAEGVHLGEDDLPVKEARRILGSEKIIGASACDLKTAKLKEKEGADYLGLGSIFNTSSKDIELSLIHI